MRHDCASERIKFNTITHQARTSRNKISNNNKKHNDKQNGRKKNIVEQICLHLQQLSLQRTHLQ